MLEYAFIRKNQYRGEATTLPDLLNFNYKFRDINQVLSILI